MKRVIETGIEYRAADIGDVDKENRTVSVVFSSEYPVKRWIDGEIGDEILEHTRGAVDLGRINDGGPLLMDHDSRDQVGIVESASIDKDRKGRAMVRFGKSQRANEVFQDVLDGIRRTLSVGYRVYKYEREKRGENIFFRAVKWEPYEITLTAVPADPTAQVGRADSQTFKTEVKTMSYEDKKTRSDDDDDKKHVEITDAVEKARRLEDDRISNLRKMGEKYNCDDLAQTLIRKGTSLEEASRAILDHIAEKQARAKPVTEIGLSSKEIEGYSIVRALNAMLSNDWRGAGLEREASDAIAEEVDRAPRGIFIPWEIQTKSFAINRSMRDMQHRVMTVGTDTAGGYLRPTEHLAGSFIELLRARTLMGTLNATMLPGLVGNVEIPRLDTGVTFNWVGEDVDGSLSDAVLGQVTLEPHTVTGQVPISRRLLKQSAPSIEQLLLSDMARGAAEAIDLAAFEGSGSGAVPEGIMNQTGIGTVSIAAWATTGYLTHAEAVEFETDVANANADIGTLAYVTTAAVRGAGKTTAIDAGSGIMLIQNNEMNGYPVYVKTSLAAKTTLFGNFEDALIGMWGVLDVEPDKAAKAAAGGLVLRVFQDIDTNIRHAGSFSKGAA